MQTLESLKRKIDSAQDLESVVRTMKTLAAVSIRQYELAVESLRDYDRTVEEGLQMLLWRHRWPDDVASRESRGANWGAVSNGPRPLQAQSVRSGAVGAVVFGSDQGMCGQFNERIVGFALDQLGESAKEDRLYFHSVGVRATGRLQEAGMQVDGEQTLPGSATGITFLVQELLPQIETWRTQRTLGRVVLFYNRRTSGSAYRAHQEMLVPVDARRLIRAERHRPSRTLPLVSMDPPRLLSSLLRQYLFVLLFRACAESQAAENASRIASMQSAERNIGDRLQELRSAYHQLRQTAITEELLEVVSGFETLVGEE